MMELNREFSIIVGKIMEPNIVISEFSIAMFDYWVDIL